MKTERIKIDKNERAEINIAKPKANKCDGKNTGGYANLVVIGPASICIVRSKSPDLTD